MKDYDRIDVSEGIDVNKTDESKEREFHYRYFLDKRFKFQPDICNGCHDVPMITVKLKEGYYYLKHSRR